MFDQINTFVIETIAIAIEMVANSFTSTVQLLKKYRGLIILGIVIEVLVLWLTR